MSSVVLLLYERDLLYIIFIRRFILVNFNLSNIKLMHMLNFLDTFSMGVTFFFLVEGEEIDECVG
jgi:hypothetical protein